MRSQSKALAYASYKYQGTVLPKHIRTQPLKRLERSVRKHGLAMKRNSIKNDINDIKKISSMFPKTVNEALNFEETEEYGAEPEMEDDMEMEEEPQSSAMDVAAFLDDIRKKALRGMAELADNPESPEYQQLKKVWSLVDRKPEPQNPQQVA